MSSQNVDFVNFNFTLTDGGQFIFCTPIRLSQYIFHDQVTLIIPLKARASSD